MREQILAGLVADQSNIEPRRMEMGAKMSQATALSGGYTGVEDLELQEFVRGFIAALVREGIVELRPDRPKTRAGFRKTIDYLDDQVTLLKAQGADAKAVRALSRVANALRQSGMGSYDGFEQALRREQLTMTKCPNPSYRQIALAVDEEYASWLIENLSQSTRELVEGAVASFAKEAG